jgi:superfamily I DNA and/or RNA helicase
VGTVDKFQGQQARVVFYSMVSSSGEEVPRGLDFLFSRNRFNVAISRAECLAYLVCSPRLLEVDCRTIEHMRLANALCRFVEVAEPQEL